MSADPPRPPAEARPPTVVREEVPLDEDARPATAGELRALRRWLAVAVVWALAATAIAVIALLAANSDDDEREAARSASELSRAQRQLGDRVDELEGRIEELPGTEDVARLDSRLKEVENARGRTSDRLAALGDRLDELEGRVEELEQEPATTTTTTPSDETGP